MPKVQVLLEFDTETEGLRMQVQPPEFGTRRGLLYCIADLFKEILIMRAVKNRFHLNEANIAMADAEAIRKIQKTGGN